MWIQHYHPNTIVLCVHVSIIVILDQRIVVVILGKFHETLVQVSKCYKICFQEHICEDGTLGHGKLDCDFQSRKLQFSSYIFP
jgi:hypothetical protein